MAPLTDCRIAKGSKRQAVSLGRLTQCVAWCGVCVSMLLLHVYVQFTASDLRISARQLQSMRVALDDRARQLTNDYERLRGSERINEKAREWKMSFTASGIEETRLPRELATKYDERTWGSAPVGIDAAPTAAPEGALAKMLAGLAGLGGEATAYAEASPGR